MRTMKWLLAVVLLSGGTALARQASKEMQTEAKPRPVFAEADAARVMDELRQALEAGSRSRFLKAFDARRMPGYAAFRDQVTEFFDKYDGFQVQYHVNQVATDGEFGGVVADVVIDAAPAGGKAPNIRRNAPVRLVLAWDGKQWKVTDWSPRSLLR